MNSDAKGLPVLGGDDDHFDYVVDEEEVYEGDNAVREGRHGDWLSIILDGEAEIIRETKKGPLRIARLGPGAFVGSLKAVMTSKASRSATLVAQTPMALGTLDMQRIYDEFGHMSQDFKRYAISLDKRLREVTQRVVEAYQGESDPAVFTKERKIMMGKGGSKTGLHVITAGTVSVVTKKDKNIIPLAMLEKGYMVGHPPFSVYSHEPEAAFALASGDCETKPVDEKALEEVYNQSSKLIRGLFDHVAACIRATTDLARDPERMAAAQG